MLAAGEGARLGRLALTVASGALWVTAGAAVAAAWVLSAFMALTTFLVAFGSPADSYTGQVGDRQSALGFLAVAAALTVVAFIVVIAPLVRRRRRRRSQPVRFTGRSWLVIGIVGAACAGFAGYGFALGLAPTAAQRSLAQIRVSGAQMVGEYDDMSDAGTDSAATYIGPPATARQLARIVTGPGVTVSRVASAAVGIPGAAAVASGTAPGRCKLEIDEFVKTAAPSSVYGVTLADLRQVRSGHLMILLIWAFCGTG